MPKVPQERCPSAPEHARSAWDVDPERQRVGLGPRPTGALGRAGKPRLGPVSANQALTQFP